ncbi:MAG: TIGR00730 family Rossman fold protein [Nitrospinota bacterium]
MNNIKSICVFCGSSEAVDDRYKKVATELGREIGKRGVDLVYGGASIGLMGCVARGVHEERGKVIGILPEFFHKKDIGYLDADELIVTVDMRERKAKMDERSDAFIVLPGGIGTLEEAIEILSLRQLKQSSKPLVFINTDGFYDKLNETFDAMIEQNFAKDNIREMFAMCPDPQSAMEYVFSYGV